MEKEKFGRRFSAFRGKLRRGDILHTSPRSKSIKGMAFRGAMQVVQGTSYGHAAIYIGSGDIIEARAGGVIKRSLESLARHHKLMVTRVRGASRDEVDCAISYIKSQVGKPFSVRAMVTSGARPSILAGSHKGKRRELDARICSNIIANAFYQRPFAEGRDIAHTRPVDIAQSSLVEEVAKFAWLEGGRVWLGDIDVKAKNPLKQKTISPPEKKPANIIAGEERHERK